MKKMQIDYRPTADLIEYANNPRLNDHAVDKTASAIKTFGFRVPLLIKDDGLVIDGHLRLKAAKKLKLKEVPIILVDDLGDAEIRALRLSINKIGSLGENDIELLKIELDSLVELDFDLEPVGFDAEELAELVGLEEGAEPETKDDTYTKKVEAPIYEITGQQPKTKELVDLTKCNELQAKINQANPPPEIKAFLTQAAFRHCVFNYELIAEFYAHQSPSVQVLMEESALVVIDFNQAIEQGFVSLSDDLAKSYQQDYPQGQSEELPEPAPELAGEPNG